jgi:hypothetical protein
MMEMSNRVLWVKLTLSYTAQGIVNVWVLTIQHRQNPLPLESGVRDDISQKGEDPEYWAH